MHHPHIFAQNLKAAAYAGDAEKIKNLLATAPDDLNILDSLATAAGGRNEECVNLLLPYATLSQRQIALKCVAANGKPDMVKLLAFEHPTTEEERALNSEGLKAALNSISRDHAKIFNEVIRFLLPVSSVKTVLLDQKKARGIDPTAPVTTWPLAMLQNCVDKIEHREKADKYVQLFGKNTLDETLVEVAAQRNYEAIETLISYTSDIARANALNTAATLGDDQAVRSLLFGHRRTDVVGTVNLNYNTEALKRTLVSNPDLSGNLDKNRQMCVNILMSNADVRGALQALTIMHPHRSWPFLQKFIDEEDGRIKRTQEMGDEYIDQSASALQRAQLMDKLQQCIHEDKIQSSANKEPSRHPTVPNHVFNQIDAAMQSLRKSKGP